MSQFYETPRSLEGLLTGAGESLGREWYCSGVLDPSEVFALALAHNPEFYRGLARRSITRRSLGAADAWLVTVEYSTGQGFTPATRAFRVGAAPVKITQSLNTRFRRTAADVDGDGNPTPGVGSAPDHQGAIGISDDGVQGCDKVVGVMSWSKTVQRAACSDAYIRTLSNLVGKTNNAPFYGYPAYTLMYMGCEPSEAKDVLLGGTLSIWNLTHTFDHAETRVNIGVGGLVVPEKRGHEYVWFEYKPAVNGGARVQRPVAAYVEEVAGSGNFELIGIGLKEGDPTDPGLEGEGGGNGVGGVADDDFGGDFSGGGDFG